MTDRYPAFSEVTEDGEVEVRIEDREGSPSKHGSILGPFPNDEEAAPRGTSQRRDLLRQAPVSPQKRPLMATVMLLYILVTLIILALQGGVLQGRKAAAYLIVVPALLVVAFLVDAALYAVTHRWQ